MAESVGATVVVTLAATPESVFDAWVTPQSFATWWGGDDIEIPFDSVALDARPGGEWRATMLMGGDEPDYHWRGEILEVDRPRRLVMTMTDEPGDEREILTVELEPVAGGTVLRFSQTGGNLTPEQYHGTAAGWRRAFEALDRFVAG